jgi:hypothetical protein
MKQRPRKPVAQPPAVSPDGAGDAAFDVWLKRGLHQMYDPVTREPIPEALLRLIRADQDRRPPREAGGEDGQDPQEPGT